MHAPPPRPPPADVTRSFALLLLAIGALAVGSGLLSRGVRVMHWSEWPHAEARHLAAGTTASARSGGAFACRRTYAVTSEGDAPALTVDSPCLVLLGPDPAPGALVEVAHPGPGDTRVLSATEVYAVGALDLVGPAVLLLGAALLASRRRPAGAARA